MKYLVFLLLSISFMSCIKEDATLTSIYIKNNSNHEVWILPYKSGQVHSTDTVKLSANEEIFVENNNARGILNNGGFDSKILNVGSDDSIVVVYDRKYSV